MPREIILAVLLYHDVVISPKQGEVTLEYHCLSSDMRFLGYDYVDGLRFIDERDC